jgi:hypothetical protein
MKGASHGKEEIPQEKRANLAHSYP